MKKYFVILLFNISLCSFSQTVDWSNVSKVLESFGTSNQISGQYLGNCKGEDFFSYYEAIPQISGTPFYRFSFCKTFNNTLVKSSLFTTKQYNLLNSTIINDLIAVVYLSSTIEDKKKQIISIYVDYFDLQSFDLVKTEFIYSFSITSEIIPFYHFISSSDLKHHALIVTGKHPETGEGKVIVKCFDSKLNEEWTQYYTFDSQGISGIQEIYQNLNGTVYVSSAQYENIKKTKIFNFECAEITPNGIQKIKVEPDPNIEIKSTKFLNYEDRSIFFAYNSADLVFSYHLNFNKNELTQNETISIENKNWIISNISNINSNKYIISFENKAMKTDYVYDEYRVLRHIYYHYYNQDILFVGINTDENAPFLLKKINRNFTITQITPTRNPNLIISPYFFVRDNQLYIIYNSQPVKQPESLSISNSSFIEKEKSSKIPLTKICVINENGDIYLKTLFQLKKDKGYFIPSFSFQKQNDHVIIGKCYKKYISFGIINFNKSNQLEIKQ